ncbi:MAG: zinc-dependent metalloprotease [Culturomica sp.]|jgi:hypothetical protein|nr:zinc-dependent metalloprotease [Culturomica sp.]
MKKPVMLLLAALFLLPAWEVEAQSGGNKKTAKVASVSKKTAYGGLFDDKKKVVISKSDFITLRKAEGKLYFEIPVKYMGKEMLMASTLSAISSGDFGDVGYKAKPPMHIRFTLQDSTVYMRRINSAITTDFLEQALSRVNQDPILFAYAVEAWSPDSTAVVIEMTDLFLENPSQFDFFPKTVGAATLTPAFKQENSSLDEIKAFDNNVTVKSTLSFGVTSESGDEKPLDDYPVTARVTRSILLLPEDKMVSRLSDSRVGVYNTLKTRFGSNNDGSEPYSVAHRWRIVPSDVAAYGRGELVEPVRKIIFYVDNTFPESWKTPVKKGVEHWNKAFEAIGFKNVIEARDFPTPKEDPDFDPDNLRYSCIRYLPSSTANAMGPSWVDPATGEIINASVIVWSNVIDLINKWRFVQTAQIDPRVRTKKMPDDVVDESLQYVIAHEVGHCLGFMHNMASSAAWPVDSLRSATFTQKYGTTPCIMDYARHNYVAQPGDYGVKLVPPDLGVYDYFLVQWNYRYLPQFTNAWDEAPTVESWVDAVAGDPIYRYGRQQLLSRYDPSSIEEDLGNDPIKASDYGIKNLKYILSNLEAWIDDDPDYLHRQELYTELNGQYSRYIRNVLMNIGGIYLTEVKEGTAGERIVPVPKAYQKAALRWVMNEYRHMEWLDNSSLKRNFKLGVGGSYPMRVKVADDFKGQIANVALSSYYSDSPYSMQEFMDDIYAETWKNLLARRAPTAGDKILQTTMVSMFCSGVAGDDAGTVDQAVAEQIRHDNRFGPAGQGFQSQVDVSAIDDSADFLANLAIRSRDLLRKAVAKSKGSTRAHYQTLLMKLNTALKDKL